jgi:hypothetical protein
MKYPKSAQVADYEVEPMSGIEPPTYGLRNRCSTTELHWLKPFKLNHLIQQRHWQYFHTATRFYHKPSEIYYGLGKRSGKQFRRSPGRPARLVAATESVSSDGHLKQSLDFVQISLRLADERGKIVRCQLE